MYVARIPNRNSKPTYLIRHDRRVGKKIIKKTILNITVLPLLVIEGIRVLLRGGLAIDNTVEGLKVAFRFRKSARHGHVAAVLGTMRALGLPKMIDPKKSRRRSLALALIASRILNPQSKRATKDALHHTSSADSLGKELGVERCDADDLYETMDWLHTRKAAIEKSLARKHLKEGALVLCDVTSSYVEGRAMDLAKHGYCRDRKKGKKQITIGLLTTDQGCPVAVEVFAGNTADPRTLAVQIQKLQQQFGLKRLVLVGDRGLLTEARIREDLIAAGIDWISALRKGGIRKIVERKHVQMSLFDEQDLAEVITDLYPGERIILCRNPFTAQEAARKREALLQATEAALEKIVRATQRPMRPLKNAQAISVRVGKWINRWKMEKHIEFSVEEGHLHYARNEASIAQEAALDGMYAIRSTLTKGTPETLVKDYKRLAAVEQAFRNLKATDTLQLRPIRHYKTSRVLCHVFLCMLAYYVQWHMKQRLAPMLFAEEDLEGKRTAHQNPVQPAQRSANAEQKARTQRNAAGEGVMSFKTLMDHLSNLSKIELIPRVGDVEEPLYVIPEPSAKQKRAFDLLGIKIK